MQQTWSVAEYVGSRWLAGLGFYSRGSGSVLREPSRTFSRGFYRALLPGDLLVGLVLVLVFSWFSGICLRCWKEKRICPPRHFIVEHSWPLYVHHKLCCGCGSTICHQALTSFHASHNWKADKSMAGTALCFWKVNFGLGFSSVLQRIPVLTPAVRSSLANVLMINLIKGLQKHSSPVRWEFHSASIQARNKKVKCRAKMQ